MSQPQPQQPLSRQAFPPRQLSQPAPSPTGQAMPNGLRPGGQQPPHATTPVHNSASPSPLPPPPPSLASQPNSTPGTPRASTIVPPQAVPTVQQQHQQHQQHQQLPQQAQAQLHRPSNTFAPNAYPGAQPIQQQNGRLSTASGSTTPHPVSPAATPAPNHTSTANHYASPGVGSPSIQSPQHIQSQNTAYTTSTFSPAPQHNIPGTPGSMGPPNMYPSNDATRSAAPAPKVAAPTKTYAYDMDDTLAGTGINLDEEEQLMNDFETRTGFAAYVPGSRSSFYGAGVANQPTTSFQAKTQEELAAEAADRAWNEAAHRYGASRAQDFLEEGFVHPGMLHARLSKIALDHNLALNLDQKPPNPNNPLGRFSNPNQWEKPEIRVTTKTSPDGTLVATEGSFLPKDALLIDQIALLSLATKERLRELLADANRVSWNRQQSSHGVVPTEWVDAAEPPDMEVVGGKTKSLKRPADEMSNGLPTPVSETAPVNHLANTVVSLGKRVRGAEEARLKKRQKRADQTTDREKNPDGTSSRAGSVAPGTPGSVAPEQSDTKTPSKKESKKASKLAEASSSSVNSTVLQFMGKKKGKAYSWMAGGGGGSGATTPRGGVGGLPGVPATGSGGRAAKGPLTQDSSHNLGQLREDSVKGRNIQMRDWVATLEQAASLTDKVVLQIAYNRLDRSDWGDKAVIPVAPPSTAAVKAPIPSPKPPVSTPAAPTPAAATVSVVEKVV
ncbi:hypothetical protein BX600DRAFT_431214 [Xylariales sp. PMI_506]|nr:hypothetical protein BX600DRAFT_431214 [Xylariales sp. PMI_506]